MDPPLLVSRVLGRRGLSSNDQTLKRYLNSFPFFKEEPVPNWIGYGFASGNIDQYALLLCGCGRVN